MGKLPGQPKRLAKSVQGTNQKLVMNPPPKVSKRSQVSKNQKETKTKGRAVVNQDQEQALNNNATPVQEGHPSQDGSETVVGSSASLIRSIKRKRVLHTPKKI